MTQLDSAARRAANDRSVLVGLLALQLGMATRQQVADTLTTWINDRLQSFDELLRERCRLSEGQCAWLTEVAASLVLQHGNEVAACLDALHESAAARSQLSRIVDPDATLDRPNQGATPEAKRPEAAPASTANRFHCLHEHARGGMGVVYVAEDRELERRIALKEIKADLVNDPHYRDHFEREARITGNLEHPGIVPVYSAGKHASGNPYFAMRLIRGVSLTKQIHAFHAGTREFSSSEFRQLLVQFISVCNTVAYAHSKNVLHRDLKPANIMVGPYGETLVVDWGLARGWRDNSDGEEPTSVLRAATKGVAETEHGAVIGTLSYMSPEQARGRVFGSKPAPDIFSLGATLFQILTGEPPFPHPEKDQYEVTLKKVEKCDFPRPSALCSRIPKPLEAICLKAMSVHPGDRYPSAELLAADIEDYLAGDPVSAFVEPIHWRLMRWAKRNRTAVASVAVAAGMLALGALGYAVVVSDLNQTLSQKNTQLAEAKASLEGLNTSLESSNEKLAKSNAALTLANAAETKAKDAADRGRLEAESARKETESVLDFLVKAFRSPDPAVDGEKLTVTELLDQAVERLEFELADLPGVQARLLNAISQTYSGLGLYHKALAAIERSCALCRLTFGESHDDTLITLSNRATVLREMGRLAEAETQLQEVIRLATTKYPADDSRLLTYQSAMIPILLAKEEHKAALKIAQETLDSRRKNQGVRHPDTLESLNSLAAALDAAGDRRKAIDLLKEAIPTIEKVYGTRHPKTLAALSNLGSLLSTDGQSEEALAVLEDAHSRALEVLGEQHPDIVPSTINLSAEFIRQKQLERGLALLTSVLPLARSKLGEAHPRTLTIYRNLCYAYFLQGKLEPAIQYGELAVSGYESSFGIKHADTFSAASSLLAALIQSKKTTRAMQVYDLYLADHPARKTLEVPGFAPYLGAMGITRMQQGEYVKAEPYLRDALGIRLSDKLQTPATHEMQLHLGRCCVGLEKYEEAERLLQVAWEGLKRERAKLPADVDAGIGHSLREIAKLYAAKLKPEQAREWQEKHDAWIKANKQ